MLSFQVCWSCHHNIIIKSYYIFNCQVPPVRRTYQQTILPPTLGFLGGSLTEKIVLLLVMHPCLKDSWEYGDNIEAAIEDNFIQQRYWLFCFRSSLIVWVLKLLYNVFPSCLMAYYLVLYSTFKSHSFKLLSTWWK